MMIDRRHNKYVSGFVETVKRPDPSNELFATMFYTVTVTTCTWFLFLGAVKGWF